MGTLVQRGGRSNGASRAEAILEEPDSSRFRFSIAAFSALKKPRWGRCDDELVSTATQLHSDSEEGATGELIGAAEAGHPRAAEASGEARFVYALPEPAYAAVTDTGRIRMDAYDTITYEVQGRVATLTLNRPDRLNGITNPTLRDYLAIETEHHQRTGASDDSREAFRAFVEKRPARFQGR